MTLEVLCGHCLNYCLCCVYWIFRTYTSCESNSFQMPKMTLKLYPKRPLDHTVQIYSEPCTTKMALWHILMGHESIDMQYILDIHIMQFISNSDNQVHSCLPKFNHLLLFLMPFAYITRSFFSCIFHCQMWNNCKWATLH